MDAIRDLCRHTRMRLVDFGTTTETVVMVATSPASMDSFLLVVRNALLLLLLCMTVGVNTLHDADDRLDP